MYALERLYNTRLLQDDFIFKPLIIINSNPYLLTGESWKNQVYTS